MHIVLIGAGFFLLSIVTALWLARVVRRDEALADAAPIAQACTCGARGGLVDALDQSLLRWQQCVLANYDQIDWDSTPEGRAYHSARAVLERSRSAS